MTDEDLALGLGQAIRIARVRRGWSQDRLGELAGTDGPHISQIERGLRNPALSTVGRIAGALGLTAAELLAAADEERARLPHRGGQIADSAAHHDEDQPGG